MKVYKYQSINPNSLDALEKRSLWYSSPSAYNDPFELRLRVPDQESIKTIKNIEILKSKVLDDLQHDPAQLAAMQDFIKDEKNDLLILKHTVETYQGHVYKLGVASFTQNNDDILMWSHYANFHKGVCLEFEVPPEYETFYIPVIYTNEYPDLDFEHFPDIDKMFTKQLVTKSEHWAYEKEFRVVRRGANRLVPYMGKLTGVIFGVNASQADQQAVQKILKDEVTYYKAAMHSMEYKMLIQAV